MSVIAATTLIFSAAAVPSAGEQAGKLYTDDLSRCLVEQTTAADRTTLIKWVFAAIAASPEVSDLSKVDSPTREGLHRSVAGLFDRLLIKDCRDKAVTALRYNGAAAIETSFAVLGEVAMRGLTNQPIVNAEFEKMASFVDTDALEALGTEAGVPMATDQD